MDGPQVIRRGRGVVESSAATWREGVQSMGEELADTGKAGTQRPHQVLRFRNRKSPITSPEALCLHQTSRKDSLTCWAAPKSRGHHLRRLNCISYTCDLTLALLYTHWHHQLGWHHLVLLIISQEPTVHIWPLCVKVNGFEVNPQKMSCSLSDYLSWTGD